MPENSSWWQETTIYQVYPRSFSDSNNDGIGDIRGIINKLDYIKDLGFETIWLSPPYVSPQRDFGYDIADFEDIAPEYGTLADAQDLIEAVHGKGMKIIFDMLMNHTSDQHPWFLESRSSRDNPKRDWYIWADGVGSKPPNNWKAMPGGSGWEYDVTTGQWYFHNFLTCQPDLNYRNPEVKARMFETLRFWLNRGVDGFRLDIFHSCFKDLKLRDNPFVFRLIPNYDEDEGFFQRWTYNIHQAEVFELAKDVRKVLDEYTPTRFCVGEVHGAKKSKNYLADGKGLNLVLLFGLPSMTKLNARNIRSVIEKAENDFAKPLIGTQALGNHDVERYTSRMRLTDPAMAKALAFIVLTMRSVPVHYYGDEIGIPDGYFPTKSALDATAKQYWWIPKQLAKLIGAYFNRDGARTPMQWSSSKNAGFSETDPWLPVHPEFEETNIEVQASDPNSLLNFYKALLRLRRQEPCLHKGALELYPARSPKDDLLVFDRRHNGRLLRIRVNLSKKPQNLNLFETETLQFSSHASQRVIGASLRIEAWGCILSQVE